MRSREIAWAILGFGFVGVAALLYRRGRPWCRCRAYVQGVPEKLLDEFDRVRRQCAALAEILLPERTWQGVRAQALAPPDQVGHRSYLLLALERGQLDRVTVPIHRLLLRGRHVRPELSAQYRADLQERWFAKPDESTRHEAFRMFFGKIVELQVAHWLSRCGWRLSALEALGGPADIQACRKGRALSSFEVKYIGRDADEFAMILKSIESGRPVGGPRPVYSPGNYLLFRAYEAAKKLASLSGPRIAVLVVDDQAWHNFELALRNRWIRWDAPVFLGEETAWRDFLASQARRYPDVETELGAVLKNLDAVWVLRLRDGYEYVLEYKIDISGGAYRPVAADAGRAQASEPRR